MLSFLKSMWEQTHENRGNKEYTHQWWMITVSVITGGVLFLVALVVFLTHFSWAVAGFIGAALWQHKEKMFEVLAEIGSAIGSVLSKKNNPE